MLLKKTGIKTKLAVTEENCKLQRGDVNREWKLGNRRNRKEKEHTSIHKMCKVVVLFLLRWNSLNKIIILRQTIIQEHLAYLWDYITITYVVPIHFQFLPSHPLSIHSPFPSSPHIWTTTTFYSMIFSNLCKMPRQLSQSNTKEYRPNT